jgi:hypothetical protein
MSLISWILGRRGRGLKIIKDQSGSIFDDQALIKQVFLAVEEASKKWTFRHRDWAMIYF